MPERSKKDHKHGRHSGHKGSRWHNFHFSGKLISCSVIFGFLLILVGGILLAIGMDRDEESKSDDYEDLQKKPPLVFVGPAIMGIGGFTVVVGVIMCLVETKVFRRRGGDANPLINSEGGASSRENESINGESDPTGIPTDSKHYRKHRHGKKSKKTANGKSPKPHSSQETSPSSSQSSEPIGISGKAPRNFLNASDNFMTPPGSFTQEDLQMQGPKRDDVTQTSASLMKSYNSSGTYSAEFQTPSASYIDSPSFPRRQDSNELPAPKLNIPGNFNVKQLDNVKHEFLTPQNSNADILESPKTLKEENLPAVNKHAFLTPQNSNAGILESPKKSKEEYSPIVNRHAFLTPQNSADLLEDSPPNEETLEQRMGNSSNHPETVITKKSLDNVTTVKVVADVHEPSKQLLSDMNKASAKPSTTNHSKSQEVEHSDIKVDVLIAAIDDEVKVKAHSSVQRAKDEESDKSPENIGSSLVTESITKENKLKDSADTVNALRPDNPALDSMTDENVSTSNNNKDDE